jgi:phosphoglycerate dehydrogenase-like enzyme
MKADGFCDAVREIGDLRLVSGGDRMTPEQIADHVREADVYMTGHGTTPLPDILAKNPGRLRYVCGITGTMRPFVPVALVEAGIKLTNWGDATAGSVAEGAMALLLATLKGIHEHTQNARANGWGLPEDATGGLLEGLKIGVFGCGVIGRRFLELLRPFDSIVRVYDPYATDVPDWCERVHSLEALFQDAEAIVLHAGWTPETDKIIKADLLRRLPDHGVIINTARGGIIDQDALFAELKSGRLRAGLDVLEPDRLPPDHPARYWSNVILTAHQVGQGWPGRSNRIQKYHQYALDNLRRFTNGESLRFIMDVERYHRST